jgi:hypothetical protein
LLVLHQSAAHPGLLGCLPEVSGPILDGPSILSILGPRRGRCCPLTQASGAN